MPLLNQFWAYSDSWHVAVNSDVRHIIHGMGGHDMAMHDKGVHDMGVHDVAVHGMAMHDMAVPCVGVHQTVNISVVKKLILNTHFRGKTPIFSCYMSLNNFCRLKHGALLKI
jgi:hypothetical protein